MTEAKAETDHTPLSESEKLAATLTALQAERAKRVESGQWTRDTLPMLIAIPRAGEALQTAQQRAVYEYLANHPDAPKTPAAYEWMQIEFIEPLPQVELPAEQWEQPDAIDVTPRRRPPSPPPDPPPIEPPRNRVLEAHLNEKRRVQRFMDDDWKPHDGPLRYPRGRNGW
jgi:hypothetical protein